MLLSVTMCKFRGRILLERKSASSTTSAAPYLLFQILSVILQSDSHFHPRPLHLYSSNSYNPRTLQRIDIDKLKDASTTQLHQDRPGNSIMAQAKTGKLPLPDTPRILEEKPELLTVWASVSVFFRAADQPGKGT